MLVVTLAGGRLVLGRLNYAREGHIRSDMSVITACYNQEIELKGCPSSIGMIGMR